MKMKILAIVTCMWASLAFSSSPGEGAMRPVTKMRAGVPPFEIVEDIMLGNRKATAAQLPSSSAAIDSPQITWLADSDARLQPSLVHIAPPDKIYTVRNLGNQLALSTGAIDYGIRYLFTPVLLITGNTGSEAIRFFMEGYEKLPLSIRQDLDHLHLPLTAKSGDDDPEMKFEERWLRNIEKNVDFQVDQALARYSDRIKTGRLVVVGAIVDFTNQYGYGERKLVIINLNGETDPKKIGTTPHLTRLDQKMRQYVGRAKAEPATAGKK
jgi:carbonic anhydrase